MEEGVAAERAHCQRHQEGEQELEAGLVEDGYEHHTQQRQQADDGDGHETPQPNPHWRKRRREALLFTLHSLHREGQEPHPLFWRCSVAVQLWKDRRTDLYGRFRSCHAKQPQLYRQPAPDGRYFSHPVCSHMMESSRGFQSVCPCDDTWRLKRKMWSDISAEFCPPHFSFKATDETHEAEEEKVGKVHYHLNCQSSCQRRTRFKTAQHWARKTLFVAEDKVFNVVWNSMSHHSWWCVC